MKRKNPALTFVINKLCEAMTYRELEDVARHVITDKHINVHELTQTFQTYIDDIEDTVPLELKLNIFEAMSAILLSTSGKKYQRHFVTRISSFVKKYSLLISEFTVLSERVLQTFNRWESAKLFSEAFMKKLTDNASTIFYFHQKKPELFKKYSKNILLLERDVRKVNETNFLREMSRIKHEKMKEVNSIRQEFEALENTSEESEELIREKAEKLKKKVELVVESLSHLLELNKEGREFLCSMIAQEQHKTVYGQD